MNAMNNPIPADIPILSVLGIEFMIASRIDVSVRTAKIAPSMKTAASAICHVTGSPLIFMFRTTPNAKNAFNPIPGASAIG